jgi:hypothetical protein
MDGKNRKHIIVRHLFVNIIAGLFNARPPHMKKLFFILSVTAYSVQAGAQERGPLSVSATGYIGANGTRSMGSSIQLKLDYHINRFSIGSGITYFSAGIEREGIILHPVTQLNNTYREEYSFRHLMLPLMVSYHAPMGKTFEFIPSAGLGASYTAKALYGTQSSDSSYFRRNFTNEEFDRNFRKVNIWGIAALNFACNVNEQLALLAAIEGQGMITNAFKPEADVYRGRQASLYFGLGLRYWF